MIHRLLRDLCDASMLVTVVYTIATSIADGVCGRCDANPWQVIRYILVIFTLIVIRQNEDEKITRCKKARNK